MRAPLLAFMAVVAVAIALVTASQADSRSLPEAVSRWKPSERALIATAPRTFEPAAIARRCRRALPLEEATTAERLEAAAIRERLREDPSSLGSAAIGLPTRGALFNGVRLEKSDGIHPVAPHIAWGTEATVASIERAVAEVRCRYADTPPLSVGSVSRKTGGYLSPHKSHQTGVDVDLGYYYTHGPDWYVEVSDENLDRKRTWALVDALVSPGNVEYLFVDRAVKEMLRETAAQAGEEEGRLRDLFDGTPRKGPIIRHARGHDDHLHVRFEDPAARHNARALMPHLRTRYRYLARR